MLLLPPSNTVLQVTLRKPHIEARTLVSDQSGELPGSLRNQSVLNVHTENGPATEIGHLLCVIPVFLQQESGVNIEARPS